jgi:hypothetical protein
VTQPQHIEARRPLGPDGWTPLVERLLPLLSRQVPEWAVLKNHARLPVVTGDIDLCVPRSWWDTFVDAYLSALAATGSFAVVVCDHYIGVRFTFAVPLDGSVDHALEIDLADGVKWKGTRLLSAADTLVGCVLDERGFRRVSTGIEAAYQLTCNAVRHGGGLAEDVIQAKAIRTKALADVDTFHRAMVSMHGWAGGWAARRFVADEWRFGLGTLLTTRRMARAAKHPLARPAALAQRKARAHWRGLPRPVEGTPSAWLRRASRGHRFHVVGPAAARFDARRAELQ